MDQRIKILVDHYKSLSEEKLQEEIDALFDIIFAMLEACESDSIESYPNPNVKISFRCDVIADGSKYVN